MEGFSINIISVIHMKCHIRSYSTTLLLNIYYIIHRSIAFYSSKVTVIL